MSPALVSDSMILLFGFYSSSKSSSLSILRKASSNEFISRFMINSLYSSRTSKVAENYSYESYGNKNLIVS